jgi:hypothetical protein
MPKYLRERQVKVGAGLYAALGIDRKDEDARQQQFMHNYRFFDAPVGIVACIDARMGKGCFMDFGMMLQTLLLAAQAEGLASCGIGALSTYGPFIAEQLQLGEHEMVVCGVALGYEDPEASGERRCARTACPWTNTRVSRAGPSSARRLAYGETLSTISAEPSPPAAAMAARPSPRRCLSS